MFVFLFLIWIIFNGRITPEVAVFGIVISAAVYAFCCAFMDFSFKKDMLMVKRLGYFLLYLVTLIWEIIKANITMLWFIIIRQEYELHPVMFKISTKLESNVCRTLLANAITLTPGTITVSMEKEELIIHAVDESLAVEDDGNFIFERILEKLERGHK